MTTALEYAGLAYRYHDIRPAGGIALAEWLVEEAICRAFDEHGTLDAAVALAARFTADVVDELRGLALEVHHAQSTAAYHTAVDEYADRLHQVARSRR